MLKRSWCLFLLCFLCLPFAGVAANPDVTQTPSSQTPSAQTPSIAEKVAGAQKFPGYFNFYWDAKQGKLWLEIDKKMEHGIPLPERPPRGHRLK